MAINPTMMIKLMGAKATFERNHPKFFSFIKAVFSKPLEEGTIIEIAVSRPGEEPVKTNIKLQQSDLELFEELRNMSL